MARLIAIASLLALGGVVSTSNAEFQSGDIYLISAGLPHPNPPPSSVPGVLKIDPLTGATQMLVELSPSFSQRAATYDPFRDRLVIKVGAASTDLILVDSDGTITDLPTPYTGTVEDLAATGDGRIYMLDGQQIAYIDAAGATQQFFDVDGVTPFNPNLAAGFGSCIYDATNNALLICDIATPGMRLRSVPLSPDGSQVGGPIEELLFDIITGIGEIAVGFSEGPNGSAFLKLDDNSNSAQPRMLLIDPNPLAVHPYAISEYFGVAGEVAGCYSSVRDQAVVLDSGNDLLRVFSFSSFGEGAELSANVSAGGSGEIARLIEIGGSLIGSLTPCSADLVNSGTFQPPGDGSVDGADLAFMLGEWGPNPGSPADIVDSNTFLPPSDGVVDGADLAFLLGSWGQCF